MDDDLRKGIDDLLASAADAGFRAALLGSATGCEIDGAVIGRYDNTESAVTQLRSFLVLMEAWRERWRIAVATSMKDQGFSGQEERVVHVLYYPSIRELEHWELPSFAAYVHDRGQFVGPFPEELRSVYRRYRERREQNASLIVLELAYYQEILVHELIHLSTRPAWWDMRVGLHRLRYVARFAAIELKVDGLKADTTIPFWDWREIHPTTFDDTVIAREVRSILFPECKSATWDVSTLRDGLLRLFRAITEQIGQLVSS